jgi:hypothetical protein
MSNFVEIRTSTADIIGIANQLRDQGQALDDNVQAAVERVTENERGTFPPDDFSNRFLENYHRPVEGGDQHGAPTNEAVKHNATGMGPAMKSLGDFVANAMWSYEGQDLDNADDIGNTPTNV